MPMHIGVAVDAVPSDWIMAQYHVIQHSHTVDLFVVFHVFSGMEDVMITTDQSLLAVQATQQREVPTTDYAISEIVDLVIWTHHAVPVGDDSCIHLIWIIPGPHFGTICSHELADVGVAKVEI